MAFHIKNSNMSGSMRTISSPSLMWSWLWTAGVGGTLGWIVCIWLPQHFRFVRGVSALPGPPVSFWKTPWLGHLGSLLETIGSIPNRPQGPLALPWFRERLIHYTEEGLYRLWFFNPLYIPFARCSVTVIHPQLIQTLLTNKKYCTTCIHKEPRIYKLAAALFGKSFLAINDGPTWKHLRKRTASAFTQNLLQLTHEKVQDLLEKWVFPYMDGDSGNENSSLGTPVEAAEWSSRMTLDVLGLVAFSRDFGALESFNLQQEKSIGVNNGNKKNATSSVTNAAAPNDQEGQYLYYTLLEITNIITQRSTSLLIRQYLPTDENKRFKQATTTLNTVIQRIVEERLEQETAREGKEEGTSTSISLTLQQRDILSYLVQRDEETGQRLSAQDIFANTRMLLFAGHDTTAAILAWSLWELAQHPESCQRKLQEEIDLAVRQFQQKEVEKETEKHNSIPYKRISSLKYLDAVVRETLRMYAPAAMARIAAQDFSLPHPTKEGESYWIPKGTKLYMFPTYTGQMYLEQGDKFDPDRFLKSSNDTAALSSSYMPFSIGPRNCVGMPMALAELKSILFGLLHRYDIRPDPNLDPDFEPLETLLLTSNPHEAPICLVRRQ